jgi:NCS1 family nucleobase:cation symporter-1
LRLADLYRPHGAYWYDGGWNWRALVAFGAGALLAVGGAWSSPGGGPFPAGGLIPALKPLYDYNWVVGFGVALVLYWGLTALSPGARRRMPAL